MARDKMEAEKTRSVTVKPLTDRKGGRVGVLGERDRKGGRYSNH